MDIKITLNGNEMTMPEGSTLWDLLELKRWKTVPMSVKINGELIQRDAYADALIYDGQNLQIVPFLGGG